MHTPSPTVLRKTARDIALDLINCRAQRDALAAALIRIVSMESIYAQYGLPCFAEDMRAARAALAMVRS